MSWGLSCLLGLDACTYKRVLRLGERMGETEEWRRYLSF